MLGGSWALITPSTNLPLTYLGPQARGLISAVMVGVISTLNLQVPWAPNPKHSTVNLKP